MAIDFPNSPTNGQTYVVGSFTWQYDGEKWISANGITLDGLSNVTVPSPTSGDFLKWNGTAWVNQSGVVTTGDTATVTSTMIAEGTIVNGDINASAGIALSKLATSTAGNIIVYNSSGVPTSVAETGDITISDTGVTAISSGVIVDADINASAGIALSKLATSTAGNIIVYNASGVPTAVAETGDITISDTGVTAIASGVIVNADVNASAAIAHSKLANATAGQVLLGTTTTGVVTATTISGDITIDGAGVVSIAANSVALGTDTTGNYMSGLSAGTGMSVTHTPAEGSTGTVGIDTAVVPQLAVTNTFSTNQVISGSTTADLLRITQTGTGNALRVEDSTNVDSTPFVIDASGNVGIGTGTPASLLHVLGGALGGTAGNELIVSQIRATNSNQDIVYTKYRRVTTGADWQSAQAKIQRTIDVTDMGYIAFGGTSTHDVRLGTGTTDIATFATTGTTVTTSVTTSKVLIVRGAASQTADLLDVQNSASATQFKIDSSGQIGIGGTTATGYGILSSKNITGATGSYGMVIQGVVQSDVTSSAVAYTSAINTAAAAFTLGTLAHFSAASSTPGAGSSIGTQVGYWAQPSLSGATNNYGFLGQLAAATGRFNLYMGGTAGNYLAGDLGIGVVPQAGIILRISKNATGATNVYGVTSQISAQSDVTSGAYSYYSGLGVAAASFTLTDVYHYAAVQGTFGAGATVTNQTGFFAASSLTGATNDYGFRGVLASATGAWNLYMDGTANNYMAGRLGVGATLTTGAMAQVTNTTAADKALVVKGAASQTGTLLDAQNSAGTTVFSVNSFGALEVASNIDATTAYMQIGNGRSAAGGTYIDLVGDTTYTDYGLRVIRNGGAGASSGIIHRGLGDFQISATEAAPITFHTTALERMRINADGGVGIGGTAGADTDLGVYSNLTGATTAYGIRSLQTIQSDVTGTAHVISSQPSTAAVAFTASTVNNFTAFGGSIGASSAITSQIGFNVASSMTVATNNYGFYGNIAAATGRWNLYMNGTADNYLSGNTGIGGLPVANIKLLVAGGGTNDSQPEFRISGSGGTTDFHNNLAAGSYNSIVAAGDKGILAIGTNTTTSRGSFVLAPWSDVDYGIRIEGGSTTNILHYGTSIKIPSATTSIPSIVRGRVSQTADLQQWQNSAGTVLNYVAANGSSSFYEGDQNILAASIFS